jgi:hypothetical protein
MTIDTVQSSANAHTTGGQDGTSHRDAGRLDGQVPSPGTPGLRAFLMTASKLSRRADGLLAVAPSAVRRCAHDYRAMTYEQRKGRRDVIRTR